MSNRMGFLVGGILVVGILVVVAVAAVFLIVERDVGAYTGWVRCVNDPYGFSFYYPQEWALEEQPPEELPAGRSARSLLLRRGVWRLLIQFRRPEEDLYLGASGLPAGEIEERGTVTAMGQEVPRHVLVYEGQDKVVYYEIRGEEIEFFVLLDVDPASGLAYEEYELSAALQEEVDEIVRSLDRGD